jgi:hypothetical protein
VVEKLTHKSKVVYPIHPKYRIAITRQLCGEVGAEREVSHRVAGLFKSVFKSPSEMGRVQMQFDVVTLIILVSRFDADRLAT